MEKYGKPVIFPGGYGRIGEILYGRLWPDWGLYGEAGGTKWYTLYHLVCLPLKECFCHLVSSGGTKWQKDTKW